MMSSRRIDLTGERFGRLHVQGYAGYNSKSRLGMWACVCDCGSTKLVEGKRLREGNTTSCGCVRVRRSAVACNPRRRHNSEPSKPRSRLHAAQVAADRAREVPPVTLVRLRFMEDRPDAEQTQGATQTE